jgi:C-terminal processing protease CtpA/Prc
VKAGSGGPAPHLISRTVGGSGEHPVGDGCAVLSRVLGQDRTQRPNGLIIDLRINGGGSDALGIHIAERLTDTPYLAYCERARNDPSDPARHTRPQPVYVTPARGPRHTGPVAVLTGGSTFSAGETFPQALMDRPRRTVRIGQPTQGVFSDVMTRKLPGGMSAWLPNEEFLTRSGRTFDGTGSAPHLTEPVSDTAPESARRARATTTGPGSTSAPASIVTCWPPQPWSAWITTRSGPKPRTTRQQPDAATAEDASPTDPLAG